LCHQGFGWLAGWLIGWIFNLLCVCIHAEYGRLFVTSIAPWPGVPVPAASSVAEQNVMLSCLVLEWRKPSRWIPYYVEFACVMGLAGSGIESQGSKQNHAAGIGSRHPTSPIGFGKGPLVENGK
jgi:hypothetical protein